MESEFWKYTWIFRFDRNDESRISEIKPSKSRSATIAIMSGCLVANMTSVNYCNSRQTTYKQGQHRFTITKGDTRISLHSIGASRKSTIDSIRMDIELNLPTLHVKAKAVPTTFNNICNMSGRQVYILLVDHKGSHSIESRVALRCSI